MIATPAHEVRTSDIHGSRFPVVQKGRFNP